MQKQREAEEKQRKIEEEMERRRLAEEAAEEVQFVGVGVGEGGG
jgi:hypothetical protein